MSEWHEERVGDAIIQVKEIDPAIQARMPKVDWEARHRTKRYANIMAIAQVLLYVLFILGVFLLFSPTGK